MPICCCDIIPLAKLLSPPTIKASVPQLDAAARLAELAWYDGLRTGLFVGFLAGVLAAAVVLAAWRR